LARGAYKILYQAGFRNMVILDEGIPLWARKRYPTARAERQG
jgi:rhodanese-related sulfurtransferase